MKNRLSLAIAWLAVTGSFSVPAAAPDIGATWPWHLALPVTCSLTVENGTALAREPLPETPLAGAKFGTYDGGFLEVLKTDGIDPTDFPFTGNPEDNFIEGNVSFGVIGGGQFNFIEGRADFASIGGGSDNLVRAPAAWATIPGGYRNEVAGEYAFAAGHRAKARHDGVFVWADSTSADFTSTAMDQFLIRASHGVGIGVNAPQSQLHLAGGQWDLARTEGDFKIGNATHRLKIGVALDGPCAGEVRLRAQGSNSRLMLGSGTNDDLRIQDQRVGIGRYPTAHALEVEGTASRSAPGHWLASSDRRIKQDIQPVQGALTQLTRVRLVQFRYSQAYRAAHPEVENRPYLNVVAQEFQEVFPDYVKTSGERIPGDEQEILQVDTYPLTIYSAAAIQELHGMLEEKEARIQALQRAVDELTARLDALVEKQQD